MLGLDGVYEHVGPYSFFDHFGYEMATTTLLYLRRLGRQDNTYTHFATIRHDRGSFSSHVRATPHSNVHHISLVDQKGEYARIAHDKCGSLWYFRFMVGMKTRMGGIWKPNKELSHQLLKSVIEIAEQKINEIDRGTSEEDRPRWIVFVAYIAVSYVLSLRGNEGLVLDLEGLRNNWQHDRGDHFVIALWGKLKGETAYRNHVIPWSGIKVKYIVQRLL